MVQLFTSMNSPAARSALLVGTQGRIELSSPWLTDPGALVSGLLVQAPSDTGTGTFGDEIGQSASTALDYGPASSYELELAAFEASVLDGAPSVYPPADSRR